MRTRERVLIAVILVLVLVLVSGAYRSRVIPRGGHDERATLERVRAAADAIIEHVESMALDSEQTDELVHELVRDLYCGYLPNQLPEGLERCGPE